MKLIIDIRDEKYRHITEMPNVYGSEICEVIRNGIPLPKGHGDLISREALKKAIYNDLRLGDEENGSDSEYMAGLQDCYNLIDNIRTDADPTPKVHFCKEGSNAERMALVQQTVDIMLFGNTGNTEVDKAFRNAARFVQNAIDGTEPHYEFIRRDEGKAFRNERPNGEWIFDGVYLNENNPFDNNVYHCSLCKRSIMTAITRPTDLFPFCHCGAKMMKEGAGNDLEQGGEASD